jgi:hypothetical protein
MLIFEKAIIKKYWPADDKGQDGEIIRQLVISVEVDIDNSLQLADLFNNMIRGLVKVSILDTVSGEEFELPAVTIKPFNVKQKKVKIGKGEESDIVKTEYAALTLVSKIADVNGGQLLADLYSYFNINVQLSIDKFEAKGKIVFDDEDDNS